MPSREKSLSRGSTSSEKSYFSTLSSPSEVMLSSYPERNVSPPNVYYDSIDVLDEIIRT